MGLTVLSLFDGMSCGQIALRELGISVDAYYASEIDKFCIAQTQLNFPDTIQLGDVRGVSMGQLPRIDLILAGSPCQGFSFAGKQLNFDDPRSKLFFDFQRIVHQAYGLNPDVKFLFENVRMKRTNEAIITQCLDGLHPVVINSALVSAQNRVRLYWSNIRTAPLNLFDGYRTDIPQPADRGLYLADILEYEVDEKYHITDKVLRNLIAHKERNERNGRGFGLTIKPPADKSIAVRVGGKGMYDIVKIDRHGYVKRDQLKASCLTVGGHGCGNHSDMDIILQRPRGDKGCSVYVDKAPTLTANAWEQNNIVCRRMVRQINPSTESCGKQPYQQNRIYSPYGIAPALCSSRLGQSPIVIQPGDILRRMTPTECARLQTIPEWYRWECSETQQYKMLGNGWTVEVIKHILSFLNK